MAKDKMKKDVAPKTKKMMCEKAGKTKKKTEGVSASLATYVNYQLAHFNRGLCVSSGWTRR